MSAGAIALFRGPRKSMHLLYYRVVINSELKRWRDAVVAADGGVSRQEENAPGRVAGASPSRSSPVSDRVVRGAFGAICAFTGAPISRSLHSPRAIKKTREIELANAVRKWRGCSLRSLHYSPRMIIRNSYTRFIRCLKKLGDATYRKSCDDINHDNVKLTFRFVRTITWKM